VCEKYRVAVAGTPSAAGHASHPASWVHRTRLTTRCRQAPDPQEAAGRKRLPISWIPWTSDRRAGMCGKRGNLAEFEHWG
jgi:hypothetical protein